MYIDVWNFETWKFRTTIVRSDMGQKVICLNQFHPFLFSPRTNLFSDMNIRALPGNCYISLTFTGRRP